MKLIALISIVSVLALLTVVSGVMLLYKLTSSSVSPLADITGNFAATDGCATNPKPNGCTCSNDSQCQSASYCDSSKHCTRKPSPTTSGSCIASSRACNTGGNCYCGPSYEPKCIQNTVCGGNWCSDITCTLKSGSTPAPTSGGSTPLPTIIHTPTAPTQTPAPVVTTPAPTAVTVLPSLGSDQPVLDSALPPVMTDSPEPTSETVPTIPPEITQMPEATPAVESGDAASGNVAIINAIGTFVVLLILTILGVIAVIIFAQAAFNEEEHNS